MVLKLNKPSIGLSSFSSAKCDILGNRYTVMESFAAHKLFVVPALCFTTLSRVDTVTHVSLTDFFSFVLNTLDRQFELQGK